MGSTAESQQIDSAAVESPRRSLSSHDRQGTWEAIRSRWASLKRDDADLVVLVALLVLTEVFGRAFSTIGVADKLFITEVMLVMTIGLLLIRIGPIQALQTVRKRMPLVPLLVFWVLGALATVRGLEAFGFSPVTEDVGVFEYSVLLPLVVLLASDRRRFELIGSGLLIGSAGCVVLFLATSIGLRAAGDSSLIFLVGSASGLYISFFVIWAAARRLAGVPVPAWQLGLAGLGLSLMWLTDQRSVWVAALLAAGVLGLLAPRGRLIAGSGAVAASLLASFALYYGVERTFPIPGGAPAVEAVAQGNTGTGTGTGDGTEPSEPQALRELDGLLGGSTAEGDNVTWRLAYWKELTRRTVTDPEVALVGIGFGQPAAFVWNDRKYDFRDGEPGTGLDVAGPHNSFIAIMYRMGIPALLAVVALLGAAVWRVLPLLRAGALSASRRVELVALLAALASTIAIIGFNEALKGPFLGMFFWVALGLIFAFAAIERGGDRRAASSSTGHRGDGGDFEPATT